MLRGFRWQLIALVAAAALFAAALANRPEPMPNQPAVLKAATVTQAAPTPAPTFTPNPGILIQPETRIGVVPTFREGVVGAVHRLNPLLANPAERDITTLIFEGLTRSNAYGEPEPNLAQSWVISSDGLEYIVTLRSDVLWQDGVPFTAADVDYTMSILRSPDFPGDPQLGRFWRTVEAEVLGDHLVRFRLTQPLGSFLDKLRIGLLPAHALFGTSAVQLASHPFNLSPIGTGPYQLEALRTNSGDRIAQIDLRAAPVYRQRSDGYAIDHLSFHIYPTFEEALDNLKGGNLDGLPAYNHAQRGALLAAADATRFDTHTALEPVLGILIFNWQRDSTRYFREQRVRLALETGINRTSTIERWLLNRAVRADSPLWPGSWAYTADLKWPPHDMETARFLLETANLGPHVSEDSAVEDQATEEPTTSPYLLDFAILAPDDLALVNLLQEFAAQWSQLNLNITVELEAEGTYRQRLESGDFDAALVELSLGTSADPDVYPFWHQGQYPDGLNYGGIDDTSISELLERARRDPSGINRDMLYDEFQRDFVERAIALPLYYPLFTYVTSSQFGGIQLGFVGSPADRFQTIKDWSLNPG
jgi:peptide/nickel transport system substrate-binding protein